MEGELTMAGFFEGLGVAAAMLGSLLAVTIGLQDRKRKKLQPHVGSYREPYRDVGEAIGEATVAKVELYAAFDERDAAIAERDKYLHALQAIATLNCDPTAQRIAWQALGREP
jgi:hypothetical protein